MTTGEAVAISLLVLLILIISCNCMNKSEGMYIPPVEGAIPLSPLSRKLQSVDQVYRGSPVRPQQQSFFFNEYAAGQL